MRIFILLIIPITVISCINSFDKDMNNLTKNYWIIEKTELSGPSKDSVLAIPDQDKTIHSFDRNEIVTIYDNQGDFQNSFKYTPIKKQNGLSEIIIEDKHSGENVYTVIISDRVLKFMTSGIDEENKYAIQTHTFTIVKDSVLINKMKKLSY